MQIIEALASGLVVGAGFMIVGVAFVLSKRALSAILTAARERLYLWRATR